MWRRNPSASGYAVVSIISEQKSDPWEPPCFIEGVPEAEYFALPGASSTALKTLLQTSPKHMREAPDKPSAAKALGSLVHLLVLQPELVSDGVAVKPEGLNRRSKAGKAEFAAWEEESAGKLICTQADMDAAQHMRDSVLTGKGRIGEAIFSAGKAEISMMATDPVSGVLCRGRADWLPDGQAVIVDLKTAASASPAEFAKSAARYGYHLQAWLYSYLHSLITGKPCPAFVHAVVESTPPYDSAFYELSQHDMDKGEAAIRHALSIWARCEESGVWPGYSFDWTEGSYKIEPLSLPRWAM